MVRYYELLSDLPLDKLEKLKAGLNDGSVHPMEAKKALGRELVSRYHSVHAAGIAEENFVRRFRDNQVPEEIADISLSCEAGTMLLCKALAEAGLVKSNSEGRRSILQGGVKVNSEKVGDESYELYKGKEYVVQVGKRRFARLRIE
jgi:tyrosyl-tRNA synthetase